MSINFLSYIINHEVMAIKVNHTLRNPIPEAWPGNEKIHEGFFMKLIANNRIPRPVHKFNWNRVDEEKGIALRVKEAKSWILLIACEFLKKKEVV